MSDGSPADSASTDSSGDDPAAAAESTDADDTDDTLDTSGTAEFDAARAAARRTLTGDDVTAFHLGVVRGGEVDTAAARVGGDGDDRGDDRPELEALTLLATHLRVVADDAGADYDAVAADAAALASQVESLSTLPGEE
ncbi:hypothetical protein [Halobaculum sp. D14]|uniref:hypothetical protein n=1 Tax=Halobaculum sp. D14 TaxID=3421642 RepID=UPI003EBDDABC